MAGLRHLHLSALCQHFQEYEKKTSHMRCQSGDSKPLFISYCKPHKPVSSAKIARWVKSMLAAAGIDITQFKAHSTRAASTSAARRLGVSTADILRSANWSRESTFERFYWREIEHPFTQAVLKGNYMFFLTSSNIHLSCTQSFHDIELVVSQGS